LNHESHYENHRRAAELHDVAAHAHRVAEQHGKPGHLTGPEHSRQALEHSQNAHRLTQAATAGHVIAFGHEEIAALAHKLWQARGCPDGSPQEDWFNAAAELRSHSAH
jgi:hypothetical protein